MMKKGNEMKTKLTKAQIVELITTQERAAWKRFEDFKHFADKGLVDTYRYEWVGLYNLRRKLEDGIAA